MALTNIQVKQAKATGKLRKLADEKSMYLSVTAKGQKYWRLDYRFGGKRKTLALGVYPEVSLAEARDKRDEARKQIKSDIDPSNVQRAKKITKIYSQENSFKVVGLEWLTKEKPLWSESHLKRVDRMLHKDLFPHIGNLPLKDITPNDLLGCYNRVVERGAIESARRVQGVAGQVLRHGVSTGRLDRDINADLKNALPKSVKGHFAAITDPKKVGKLLITLDGFQGTPVVAAALNIMPFIFCRTKQLRYMEWSEIDFDEGIWHTPLTKVKSGEVDHIVPLCRQVIAELKKLFLHTGDHQYVFPSAKHPNEVMSDMAMLAAFRRLGIPKEEMTPHGFRTMARTMLDEQLDYRFEWIDCQLAHSVQDANGRAYNRTTYLPQRKEMMQSWADYLDNLKAEALNGNVIAGNFKQGN